MTRKKVGVLISGRGSNMSALIEASKAPDYPAEIVGVLSNRAAAPGLATAQQHGIATASLAQSKFLSREMFEDMMTQILEGWEVDYVCLAGFMRILGEDFVLRWQGRMVNIHPSLLPLYKGLDTHARVLAAGDAEHGCTVHFVTPGLDEGPAILQARVPVLPGDTPETLTARVLVEEHKIYPQALAMLARGEVSL
ncbi:phosphoribosylglycinamide formyltransferase [Devosia sp. Root685]|uniref:phosphoribosylglycinamide formyltransferase n=1 Tax=Devosia sp. Root685 TaxID=1736587 RepID=UPI0006F5A180|nr:phosphoribosylglycinamide formyltransferase [Devosia sp. Root685]KRA99522.1 phosphoribosylglycinamide formyltransferase [Devosia sp. Root685]